MQFICKMVSLYHFLFANKKQTYLLQVPEMHRPGVHNVYCV